MTQREIIKPQTNAPVVVKLDFGPEGLQCDGKFGGVEYQYTVNDNSGIMWLKPEARQAILASGAKAGDSIQLLKSMQGKTTVWSAEVVGDSYEPEPVLPPAPVPARVAPAKLPKRVYYSPDAKNPEANANLARQPQAAPPQRPVAQLMAACVYAAIDAVLAGEAYAKEKGLPLEFTSEDVRAIAISLSIKAEGR